MNRLLLSILVSVIVSASSSLLAQHVTLYPDTLNFGSIPFDGSATLNCTLVNTDTADIIFDGGGIDNTTNFTLTGVSPVEAAIPHYHLQPGDSIVGTIEFNPGDTGVFTGNFNFYLGDGTTHALPLIGRGVEASSVKLTRPLISDVTISPNPTSDRALLGFASKERGLVDVRLIDGSGRIIQELQHQPIHEGITSLELSLSGIPKGSYVVEVISNQVLIGSKKLMVVR